MENSSKKKRIKLTSDVKQIILIVAAFTIMILVFSIGSEYFLKKDNIITILISAVPLGLIAIGECACLVTGVFDMSPGMVASLAGVIWATLITQFGMNTWLAFAIALFFGLFSGAIAGVSTAWFMMPAWMSTYALMQIWRGVIMIITGGKAINMSAYPEFKVLGQTKITNSITLPILLLIIIYVIVYFVFKYTKFGRSLFIVGGNIEAAKNAGLPVKSIQFFVLFCPAVWLLWAVWFLLHVRLLLIRLSENYMQCRQFQLQLSAGPKWEAEKPI